MAQGPEKIDEKQDERNSDSNEKSRYDPFPHGARLAKARALSITKCFYTLPENQPCSGIENTFIN